jgi:hypothetical protein
VSILLSCENINSYNFASFINQGTEGSGYAATFKPYNYATFQTSLTFIIDKLKA